MERTAAASIALMNNNLNRIPFLIKLSRATSSVIRQNLAIGIGFILLGLPAAARGYIDPIFAAVNYLSGGGVWDPSIRGIYRLPAKLEWGDVLSAVSLSLFLSWVVTLFPARRAARMNPVEALRYE